jgi:hypothetical protein
VLLDASIANPHHEHSARVVRNDCIERSSALAKQPDCREPESRIAPLAVEVHAKEPFATRHRQDSQEERIDESEDRDRCAEAETNRSNRGDREERVAKPSSESIPEVALKFLEPTHAGAVR